MAFVDPYARFSSREKWQQQSLEDFMEQLELRQEEREEQRLYDEARKAAEKKRKSQAAQEAQGGTSIFDRVGDIAETGGRFLFDNTAKVANSAAELGQDTFEIARALSARATGNREAEEAAVRRGMEDRFSAEGQGIFGSGGLMTAEEASQAIDPGEFTRDVAGSALGAAAEIVPFGRGYNLATQGLRTGSTAARVGRGAAEGAAFGAAAGTGQELLDDEGFDLKDVGLSTVIGGLMGGAGGAVGSALGRRGVSASDNLARKADDYARFQDDFNNGRITDPSRMLGDGRDTMKLRLQEIDDELDAIRGGDPNVYTSSVDDMTALAGEPAGNARITQSGGVDQRGSGARVGAFGETSGAQLADSTGTAQRARQLMRERRRIQSDLEGLESAKQFDEVLSYDDKLDLDNPTTAKMVDNELEAIDSALRPEEVTGKVNFIVDYFRTPSAVLRKIGLGRTARQVENSFENYRREYAQTVNKVKGWRKEVANDPEASRRIFQFLDGDDVQLSPQEMQIARQMRKDFESFADRLGIPEENRLSDYITHIFDKDFKGDTIDPTLARILENKPTGRVYNPFTKKRLGKQGYIEDAFEAYEAYSKRAARAVNMDKPLKMLSEAADSANIDQKTANYIINFSDRVAMKPAKLDEMLNHVIESVPGGSNLGPNAGVRGAQGWRNNIYRATLGLNVSSAVRNLTQATNTFAELGTRDTVAGYSKLVRALGQGSRGKMTGESSKLMDELIDMDIIGDAIHRQDDQLVSLRKGIARLDRGLWAMFDTAEFLNRGSAYFGAKNKFIRQGMSEDAAREAARQMVSKTQFRFNDVETPLALRSQVAKTLTQFQSFNIKQTEYLAGMSKGAGKSALKIATGNGSKQDAANLAKVVRWIGANMAMAGALGEVLGIEWYSSIPFNPAEFRGVEAPTVKIGKGVANVIGGENEYGQDTPRGDLAQDQAWDTLFPTLVPGGTQARKSVEGFNANQQGASTTDAGRVRYLMPDDRGALGDVSDVLMGQYANENANEYFDREGQPLGEGASGDILGTDDTTFREQMYDFYTTMQGQMTQRNEVSRKVTELAKQGNVNQARRLAMEWNATLDLMVADNFEKYGYDPDLEEALAEYKLSVDPGRIKARGR